MQLFNSFNQKDKEVELCELEIGDEEIIAMADGEVKKIETVSDPIFAQEMLGKSIAFDFKQDKVTLCSPANGKLTVLFPTGHAFGVTMNNGIEILIHCGIDTVKARGDGFHILNKIQDDYVKAGEPILEVDFKKLRKKYDMSTILILTTNPYNIAFKNLTTVTRGDSLI